jgi:RNA polymerase sigma-70 factor, ECF subfamily
MPEAGRMPRGIPSDEDLMDAMRRGDPAALDALLSRYWADLVSFVAGFLYSRDEAEDVVQESFVTLWERRERWEPRGSVRSYLYRVSRNHALNEARATRVRQDRRGDVSALTNRMPATPADHFDENRVRKLVEEAVASLPERRREVFILARYHGLAYNDIAEALGISPQTVANQMSRALTTLRRLLEGVTVE